MCNSVASATENAGRNAEHMFCAVCYEVEISAADLCNVHMKIWQNMGCAAVTAARLAAAAQKAHLGI